MRNFAKPLAAPPRHSSFIMISKFSSLCAGFMTLALTSTLALAQNTNPQGTLQQVNGPISPAQNLSPVAAVANQNSDLAGLSVVNKYPVPSTLTFSNVNNLFWTDNAFLTNNAKVGSFGYNGQLMATYVPYSTRDWTPSLSFQQQFIRYDHTSVLDFDAQTVSLASRYDLVSDKTWSWLASYSLQRLYTDRAYLGEYYKESNLTNEIDYTHSIFGQSNLYFLGAYDITWRLTDPNQYCRVDNSFTFSVVYLPLPQVSLQAYARPAIYAYTDNEELNPTTGDTYGRSRTDYNVSLGLLTTYSPIKQVSLSANFNWIGNYSNVGDREYQTITPAVTVSGTIGFW